MNTWRRAADIFGLSALALAYPLFDVLSRSPEFFVARNNTVAHVVSLALIVCVFVPAVFVGLALGAARIHRRAGALVHSGVLTLLVIVMVMTWLNRVDGLSAGLSVPLAVALGVVFAVGYSRTDLVRLFVTALSPAILVVPSWFLLNEDVHESLVPTAENFATVALDETPPMVFIVLDEFPLSSLLDQDYAIDPGRYPNFAALAASSYWFRNATTVSSQTVWAVPAIVSGTYPLDRGAVPTRRYYPNNLFTVLSGRYDMTVFGRFLQLCPTSTCSYDLAMPAETAGRLAADSAIVLLHIILPEPLTRGLPTIVGDWRGFARARVTRDFGDHAEPNQRHAEFDRFLATVEKGKDARLYFLHSLLPHMPFEYVPSGRRYEAPDYQAREVGGKRLFEAAGRVFVSTLYQRHLLQVGFVDALIGRLVERLREQEIYDKALLVVTSDHGASYHEGLPRRALTYGNEADIALVPLFIKLPGQQEGVVTDMNAQTIDILPTVADVLSIDLPFGVDGQSLLTGDGLGRAGKTFIQRNQTSIAVEPLGDLASENHASVDRKVSAFGSQTNDRLYGVGPFGYLLGADVSDLSVTEQRRVSLASSNLQNLDKVVRTEAQLPYVSGVLETTRARAPHIAIALNGVIAATTESYRENGAWVFATMLFEDGLRDGENDVRVYTIRERASGRVVLARVLPRSVGEQSQERTQE